LQYIPSVPTAAKEKSTLVSDSLLRRPFARRSLPLAGTLLASAFALILPGIARAQWPAADAGLPVCTAPYSQSYRTAISDGAGGMFVAWSDMRYVVPDIYAQHVSASGAILWRYNGTLVCGAGGRQDLPVLAADGAGGIVVAWRDYRADTDGDIYAQRIGPDGSQLWAFNGVPVCTAVGQQVAPVIAVDSVGGSPASVVIAWEDDRAQPRIYAQRLDPSGVPQWEANGRPVTTSLAPQFEPAIVTGGPFGTILAWSQQGDSGYDIFAGFLGHAGQPLWDPAGAAICVAAGDQYHPIAVSDSASGAWFAWEDDRGASIGVYAQRVTLPGFFVLGQGGVPVCPFGADQLAPAAVADGRGGLLVAWGDARVGSDIYAQRLDPAGARLWPASGEVVCDGYGTHAFPSIAADGLGGALVAWEDERAGTGTDIYAQRMDSLGTATWAAGGTGICTASANQFQPALVSTPDTVGVVVWMDLRGSNDIYCQRVPLQVTQPRPAVPLVASPNPMTRQATFEFATAGAGRAELTIYDAAGRRVRTLDQAVSDAGVQRVPWDARDDSGRTCTGGVYFARLAVDGHALATRRITIVR
jgi:hypothetical protein